MSGPIEVKRAGVSLILIIVAIILFVVAALGVGAKLGFDLVDLGLAFFAAAFIF
jgi:hypothetical protein